MKYTHTVDLPKKETCDLICNVLNDNVSTLKTFERLH